MDNSSTDKFEGRSRRPVVVIVGLPGVGKSTVGRRAARTLGWSFIDLDTFIEQSNGRTIPEIFEASGEDEFRRLETVALIEQLSVSSPTILSAGGGVVTRTENCDALDSAAAVIWMTATQEELESRLRPRMESSRNHRPLLSGDLSSSLGRLIDERNELYERVATHVVSTSGRAMEEIVDEVVSLVRKIRSVSIETRASEELEAT